MLYVDVCSTTRSQQIILSYLCKPRSPKTATANISSASAAGPGSPRRRVYRVSANEIGAPVTKSVRNHLGLSDKLDDRKR